MPALSLLDQRKAAIDAANRIVNTAKAEGRLTLEAGEVATVNGHLAEVDALDLKIKAADDSSETLRRLSGASPGFVPTEDGGLGVPSVARYLNLGHDGRKSIAASLQSKIGVNGKALAPAGTAVTDVPLTPSSPVAQGQPAASIFDVLFVVLVMPNYAYLKQTTRSNAAAAVATGGTKPTSTYGLTRVEDRLRVVAHLSEPVDRFWLEDAPSLRTFLANELLYGLSLGVEAEVLGGDGTGESFTGLAHLSGVQSQALVGTDLIHTARSAVTKLQTGHGEAAGAFWLVAPEDWEAIETQTISAGQFVLTEAGAAVPIEQASRRLWGFPVVPVISQAPGTGWLVATDAVSLGIDTQGVRVDWSDTGDSFAKNQLIARCEARYNLLAYRPLGVVKVALS